MMLRFILKRLGYGILVLWGVATAVFFLFAVLPSDPARMMMGQRTDVATEEAIRKELGLDLPLGMQYLNYLNDISPLAFARQQTYANSLTLLKIGETKLLFKAPYLRRSYQSKRPVSEILTAAFPATAVLALAAIFFAIIVGIGIGILCAVYKDRWVDKIALIFSVIGMSLPSFFAAIVLAWLFAFVLADFTGLSMFGSLYSVDNYGTGEYLDFKNLILPAITLGIRPLAVVVELTKNSLLEVLHQDYIRTAYAKGLKPSAVMFKHALKNALNPVVTAISGWLASLFAGAVFVEYVFDWKGMGVVMVDALDKYDFPVVMGALLFISVILVIIGIIVDILYGFLDPRVKVGTV